MCTVFRRRAAYCHWNQSATGFQKPLQLMGSPPYAPP